MGLGDAAVLVDQVRDAAGVLVFRTAGGTVGNADLPIRVADQRKSEPVFRGELPVLFGRVEADPDDRGVLFPVLLGQVPEPGPFRGSPGCVGLWIEPEDDFLSAQIAQADALSFMVDGFEIGCGISRLEHACSSRDLFDREPQGSEEGHGLIVDRRPQTADRRPRTADRRPQTADRRPQTADRRPQTADRRPRVNHLRSR